jgi:hypothetical protein
MNWIKWKYKEFKKRITYFLFFRSFWRKLFISESEKSYWEIVHDSKKENVTLYFIPEEDCSKKYVKIKLSYEQFEDLVKFMNRIK